MRLSYFSSRWELDTPIVYSIVAVSLILVSDNIMNLIGAYDQINILYFELLLDYLAVMLLVKLYFTMLHTTWLCLDCVQWHG